MLGVDLDADAYLERFTGELRRVDRDELRQWADLLYAAWRDDRAVYLIGNGGSATTASHMAEDLGKSTLRPEQLLGDAPRRMKVLSLTDNVGWLLAVGNDVGYEHIFSQQLMNYGQAGDLLIAISGSGNSPNILRAVEWANAHDLVTFGLTGFNGGRLKPLARHGLHVRLDDMGMVESIHLALFHWVLNDLFARIQATGRYGD